MKNEPSGNPEISRLDDFLSTHIVLDIPDGLFDNGDTPSTIDLLERALEVWRLQDNVPENKLPLEQFIQSNIFIDGDRFVIQFPKKLESLGSGTPSIYYQPRLLLFLLLYHRERYSIYSIIERFIGKVRGQLELLDFKKTRTGVTRCFTNTRFAARTLREYGLIKYTDREAYKTWVLSLPGFLVASKVLDAGIDWTLPPVNKAHNFTLHSDIRSSWEDLKTYEQFVQQLSRICEPNVEVFETFNGVLKEAFNLLPGYWEAIQDHSLSQQERREETILRLRALEEIPQIDEFYKEFSACVNVEHLLSEVD